MQTGALSNDTYTFAQDICGAYYNQGPAYNYNSFNYASVPNGTFGSYKVNSNLLPYIQSINSSNNNIFIADITNMMRTEGSLACANAIKSLSGYFVGINNTTAKPFTDSVVSSNNSNGQYLSDSDINTAMSSLGDFIVPNLKSPVKSSYILLNEPVNYIKSYTNPEFDVCVAEMWNFKHDEKYFTNSIGKIVDTSGIYTGNINGGLDGVNINSPLLSFDKVGKFHIGVSVKDNPNPTRAEISRYGNLYYQDLIVNRRPVSDFSYTATLDSSTGKYIPTLIDYSYDFNHSDLNFKRPYSMGMEMEIIH